MGDIGTTRKIAEPVKLPLKRTKVPEPMPMPAETSSPEEAPIAVPNWPVRVPVPQKVH
jgi:hypothetical protein